MPLLPAIETLYSANKYKKHRVKLDGNRQLAAVFYFADGASLTRYYNDRLFVTINGETMRTYKKKLSMWKMTVLDPDENKWISYLYESELNDDLQTFIDYHQCTGQEEMPR